MAVLLLIFFFKGIKNNHISMDRTAFVVLVLLRIFSVLFVLIFCSLIVLYVFFFLFKNLKTKYWRQTIYYLFFWLINQGLVYWISYYFQKNVFLKLTIFLLLPFINGLILYHFLSKPVIKLLHSCYPNYFPVSFYTQPRTYAKVDGFKITVKKLRSTSWTLMFTLSLIIFQIILSLFTLIKE
ncbi:MAG: hypothetical protein MRERC_15c015 [Mycoplasmataceae bacterium RC_NB112A]|nr:MAG: hypothetical protein MRERC_15c015 [Mycoplasmataceae bacterium RC_NB112A]